jgi:hypothetical protein
MILGPQLTRVVKEMNNMHKRKTQGSKIRKKMSADYKGSIRRMKRN